MKWDEHQVRVLPRTPQLTSQLSRAIRAVGREHIAVQPWRERRSGLRLRLFTELRLSVPMLKRCYPLVVEVRASEEAGAEGRGPKEPRSQGAVPSLVPEMWRTFRVCTLCSLFKKIIYIYIYILGVSSGSTQLPPLGHVRLTDTSHLPHAAHNMVIVLILLLLCILFSQSNTTQYYSI